MRNIIGYKVIQEASAEALSEAVMVFINEGWRPIGAPGSFSKFDGLYQALVLYEREDESWFEQFGLTRKTDSRGPG